MKKTETKLMNKYWILSFEQSGNTVEKKVYSTNAEQAKNAIHFGFGIPLSKIKLVSEGTSSGYFHQGVYDNKPLLEKGGEISPKYNIHDFAKHSYDGMQYLMRTNKGIDSKEFENKVLQTNAGVQSSVVNFYINGVVVPTEMADSDFGFHVFEAFKKNTTYKNDKITTENLKPSLANFKNQIRNLFGVRWGLDKNNSSSLYGKTWGNDGEYLGTTKTQAKEILSAVESLKSLDEITYTIRMGENNKNASISGAIHYEHGGNIPNNYSGKLAEQVWDEWTPQQREHFLLDHQDLTGKDWNKDVLNTTYDHLPMFVIEALREHVQAGQYENGGDVDDERDIFAGAKQKGKESQDFTKSAIEYVGGIKEWNKLTAEERRQIVNEEEGAWSRNSYFEQGGIAHPVKERLTKQGIKAKLYKPSGDFFIEEKGDKYIIHFTPKDASINFRNLNSMNAESVGKGYHGSAYSVNKILEHKFKKGGETNEFDAEDYFREQNSGASTNIYRNSNSPFREREHAIKRQDNDSVLYWETNIALNKELQYLLNKMFWEWKDKIHSKEDYWNKFHKAFEQEVEEKYGKGKYSYKDIITGNIHHLKGELIYENGGSVPSNLLEYLKELNVEELDADLRKQSSKYNGYLVNDILNDPDIALIDMSDPDAQEIKELIESNFAHVLPNAVEPIIEIEEPKIEPVIEPVKEPVVEVAQPTIAERIETVKNKIKGFKIALSIAEGEKKKTLQNKIKGFQIALSTLEDQA